MFYGQQYVGNIFFILNCFFIRNILRYFLGEEKKLLCLDSSGIFVTLLLLNSPAEDHLIQFYDSCRGRIVHKYAKEKKKSVINRVLEDNYR